MAEKNNMHASTLLLVSEKARDAKKEPAQQKREAVLEQKINNLKMRKFSCLKPTKNDKTRQYNTKSTSNLHSTTSTYKQDRW